MTCEPIEIICEDCGRLQTSVLVDTNAAAEFTRGIVAPRREIAAFILKMHREAQHGEKA